MMISCIEAGRLLSESLDRKLSFWEKVKLRFHAFICSSCSRGGKQVILVDEAARRLAANPDLLETVAGVKLPEKYRRQIKEALASRDD